MRKKESVLLGLILIIAIFFRLYHFTQAPPGLYPDEAMDGNSAVQALESHNFKVFYTEDNGREGLYVNMVALTIGIFDPGAPSEVPPGVISEGKPWAVRLPAAIAGILTVLGLYFLGKELFSEDVGLLAAFFLAVSFWHINFSRIGFRAILAPFFLTWAIILLIRAWRSEKKRTAVIAAIAAGIMYGLGFYTYIAYRITPLLLLLFVPFFHKKKGFWTIAVIFLLATFIAALPIGLYFLHNPGDFFGRTSQISIFSQTSPARILAVNLLKTFAMFNIMGDGNQRHNYNGEPELEFIVGILFLAGIVIGIGTITKRIRGGEKSVASPNVTPQAGEDNTRSYFPFLILFTWFVLAALPVALSSEGIPHALRSILMIPPAMLLAATGGLWVYAFFEKYISAIVLRVFTVIVFAYLVFFAYHTYFVLWANDPATAAAFNANYVAIGNEINQLPVTVPKYVVIQTGGVPVPVAMPDGTIKQIPTPAMTVMYITHTYTAQDQAAKNVHYLLPEEAEQIPLGAPTFTIQ